MATKAEQLVSSHDATKIAFQPPHLCGQTFVVAVGVV